MKLIVVTIRIKPGMGAPFEAVAREMRDQCLAHEPGCKLYQIGRGEAADTYTFVEAYADDAAMEAHRKSDHFRTLGRKMGEFMDGKPEALRLETI